MLKCGQEGHGLAGAILAHTLINRGIKVTCTEGQIKHSASRIAAGLINPFIGPKLNPPPTFGKCMESNFQFFSKTFSCSKIFVFIFLIIDPQLKWI